MSNIIQLYPQCEKCSHHEECPIFQQSQKPVACPLFDEKEESEAGK